MSFKTLRKSATQALSLAAAVGVGASLLASPVASAEEETSSTVTREAASDEDWAPVQRLRSAETGPQPGTTCSSNGQVRKFVELQDSFFAVEGKISTTNDTEGVIPLKQTLKESKSKKWTWSAAVTVKLTDEIKRKYEWEYNREMFWSLGQNVGPYDLYPGERGTLAWGFIMDNYTAQNVRCDRGTWTAFGRQEYGNAPRERHVEAIIREA